MTALVPIFTSTALKDFTGVSLNAILSAHFVDTTPSPKPNKSIEINIDVAQIIPISSGAVLAKAHILIILRDEEGAKEKLQTTYYCFQKIPSPPCVCVYEIDTLYHDEIDVFTAKPDSNPDVKKIAVIFVCEMSGIFNEGYTLTFPVKMAVTKNIDFTPKGMPRFAGEVVINTPVRSRHFILHPSVGGEQYNIFKTDLKCPL